VVGTNLDGSLAARIIDRTRSMVTTAAFVLTDYKTVRSPRPDRSRSRLAGVCVLTAHLCEAV